MRWEGQALATEDESALPGLGARGRFAGLVRTVETPEFRGTRFHEVLAKSALNHLPAESARMPLAWTINPYRGCGHQCVYCFARSTHRYLDLDAGEDFDREIVVKVNIVEVLRRELARRSWAREVVSLGTNTDPYQRAEGRYALMPGIIEALADSRTPFSILTKGTLLRRDLPLLAEAAKRVEVSLAMSIAIYDDATTATLEPGVPSATARLETVRAAAAMGFDVSVFLMPVLPYLTDTRDHLERAAAQIREAGASRAVYSALHLRPGAKEWFFAWLERERPDLLPRYRAMYGRSAYAPKAYREWLAAKVRPILAGHGLSRLPRGSERELGQSPLASLAAPQAAVPLPLFE